VPRAMSARAAEQVELFTTKPPKRPYAEVGVIDADHKGGTFSAISNREVLQKGRELAGQKGCDAVVVSDVSNYFRSAGDAVTNQKGYQLTCLVWVEQ
jgi:hypothetical protein